MMMTSAQRRLVCKTVGSLRDQADPISLLFYGRLFELDPSARRLFHNDLALQGRKVIETLNWMAESGPIVSMP